MHRHQTERFALRLLQNLHPAPVPLVSPDDSAGSPVRPVHARLEYCQRERVGERRVAPQDLLDSKVTIYQVQSLSHLMVASIVVYAVY